MNYIFYSLCIIFLIGIIIYFNKSKRKLKQQHDIEIKQIKERQVQDFSEKEKKEISEMISKNISSLQSREQEVRQQIEEKMKHMEQLNKQLSATNILLNEQRSRAQTYEQNLRLSAEQNAQKYEKDLRSLAENKIAIENEENQRKAKIAHEEVVKTLNQQADIMRKQVQELQNQINEYTAKQTAINEAIMRQRAIEEKQDFYRVCLAPETANDVEILNQARRNLKKPEIIDKIIYDNYIAKPVLEMIKRVLQNSTYSGIYKITCLKTGEIYIGKSTDVKNRWQQHCKSAFNCGSIASSLLHKKMQQYGIENFTFELLEVVPKDQLTEREKFYINFYQTKEVGLNERNG